MKNERILSFNMSQQLTDDDLEGVSAAGFSSHFTGNGTYQKGSGWDGSIDVSIDP